MLQSVAEAGMALVVNSELEEGGRLLVLLSWDDCMWEVNLLLQCLLVQNYFVGF